MGLGFKINNRVPNIPNTSKVAKVAELMESTVLPSHYIKYAIAVIVVLVLVLLYLLYKSNKCACMPELTELRDELLDTVVDADTRLRSDIERQREAKQRENEKAEEEAFSLTYSSPAYKPQLVHKAPSMHGYDMEDSPSVDGGGNQVTEISELQGDGFTVLDTNMLNDVQNGVVNLDAGGNSESWMMPGQGLDPMISNPAPISRY